MLLRHCLIQLEEEEMEGLLVHYDHPLMWYYVQSFQDQQKESKV